MSAVKYSVSFPEKMLKRALKRAEDREFPTFSGYIQSLVRDDLGLDAGAVQAEEVIQQNTQPKKQKRG